MGQWDPDSYLKYKDERTQPSYDLVARIGLAAAGSIVDIGCGPGNSTKVLRERWPQARIIGLDSSPEMIAAAQKTYPGECWVLADAAAWAADERFDLVFSNAALQWIPDHERLVEKLFAMLSAQGALAVQVPANNDSPLYRAVIQVAQRGEWREAMTGCNELLTYHEASFYYDLLAGAARRVDIWQTTYYHVMADRQGLISWYASTGLKPYLERLPSNEQKEAFQKQVLEACRSHYAPQRDGKVLFPFRRLFFIAYRG